MLITRYIARAVIVSTVIVSFIFIVLLFFMGLVNELGSTNNFTQLLLFGFSQVPTQFYPLFPVTLFLGVLIGLGRLNAQSELVVIRASGVSTRGIMLAVMKAGLLLILLMTVVGELMAPVFQLAYDQAREHNSFSLSFKHRMTMPKSVWIRQGKTFTHITAFEGPNKMQGVMRYFFDDDDRIEKATYATVGAWNENHWELRDLKETIFKSNHVEDQTEDKTRLDVGIRSNREASIDIAPEDQTLNHLYETISYRQSFGLNANARLYAFWKRILQPVSSLIMIVIAVPFVFGSSRNASASLRILLGVILGVIFYMLSQLFGPITIVYDFPPFFAAVMPTLVFASIAVILMMR